MRTPAGPPGPAAPAEIRPSEEAWRLGALGPRRRKWVVDPRYQLRVSGLAAAATLLLLLLLNLSLFFAGPTPAPVSVAADSKVNGLVSLDGAYRVQFGLLLAGSLVFLGGIFLVGILESHRTAGAAFAIRRGIEALREGDHGARVTLRRGDHLQELGTAFNAMAADVETRANRDADSLEALAARAETTGSRDVAVELRRLADARRRPRR